MKKKIEEKPKDETQYKVIFLKDDKQEGSFLLNKEEYEWVYDKMFPQEQVEAEDVMEAK
jgi:hypothetical protein